MKVYKKQELHFEQVFCPFPRSQRPQQLEQGHKIFSPLFSSAFILILKIISINGSRVEKILKQTDLQPIPISNSNGCAQLHLSYLDSHSPGFFNYAPNTRPKANQDHSTQKEARKMVHRSVSGGVRRPPDGDEAPQVLGWRKRGPSNLRRLYLE